MVTSTSAVSPLWLSCAVSLLTISSLLSACNVGRARATVACSAATAQTHLRKEGGHARSPLHTDSRSPPGALPQSTRLPSSELYSLSGLYALASAASCTRRDGRLACFPQHH
eukprot:2852805-Pleurochrysis_carterae.AAC.1